MRDKTKLEFDGYHELLFNLCILFVKTILLMYTKSSLKIDYTLSCFN